MPVGDRARIDRWIDHLAEEGRIHNKQKFKELEDVDPTIFAFKSNQHRLHGFFAGKGSFFLTNGYFKHGQKISKKDKPHIDRAHRNRSATLEYLNRGD